MKINLRSLGILVSCCFVWLPMILSTLIGGSHWFTVLGLVLGCFILYTKKSSGLLQWQCKALLVWGGVFALSLLNRNGDIQRGSYSATITLFLGILFTTLCMGRDKRFIIYSFYVALAGLLVHLIGGFYFLSNPNELLQIGHSIFNLTENSYQRFTYWVNNGAFMGFTTHYSDSGMYMGLATVMTGALLLAKKKETGKWEILPLLLFLSFFVALALTQKRAQLLFSVAALILMYLVGCVSGNLKKRLTQLIVAVIVFLILFYIFLHIPAFQAIIDRFDSSGDVDDVSSGRVSKLWTPAIEEFLQNPIFGMGWRQFCYAHPMTYGSNYIVYNDCHNIYIQLLAENGIFGLSVMFVMLRSLWKTHWTIMSVKTMPFQQEFYFLLFSYGYQIFFLLYGLTGNPLYTTKCLLPYLSCYAIAAAYRKNTKYSIALRRNRSNKIVWRVRELV